MFFQKYNILLYLYLNVSSGLGERRSANPTSSKAIIPFLDRFHQNDYKVTYEWAEVVRLNKEFAEFTTVVYKYNRTTTAKNFTFIPKVDMGYQVEIVVQAYKFTSNEYREFPLRFQLNGCAALNKKIGGMDKFAQDGNFTCPLLKRKRYVVVNWTPEELNFPPFVPTGKYMVEVQFLLHSIEWLVTREYATVYRPITVFED